MRDTVIAFYVVMGILLALLACALILWIAEAIRKGYTPKEKQPSERSEEPSANFREEGESTPHADGVAEPHGTEEAEREKQPQGP